MTHKLALDPPQGPLTLLTDDFVDRVVEAARVSPRRRIIAPFHKHDGELLHRMLNAVEPDSYIRPHRHLAPPKDEAWVLLRGSVAFFTFDDAGSITNAVHLAAGSSTFGVDLAAGIYHTFVALETGTVIYEVKPGPYAPADDKTYAPFAPAEGAPTAAAYLEGLRSAYLRGAQN
jgi:cupin fold WbuC family metalloprotein